MKRLLLWISLLLFAGHAFAAAPLPGDSVYQLNITLTDQNGHAQAWATRRGRVQLMAMFYTSCTMTCPLIVDTMKLSEQALDAASRRRLDLLLVSFDSARDDVAALRAYADHRKLDTKQWTLARAQSQDVRQLAALLGLQYRQLPNGDFNHSSELILLDADGRILARTSVIGKLDPAFVQAMRQALAAK